MQLSDNIWYNMDWTILSDNVKKDLIMIMNRATIPIEFSSSNLLPMNLDSFVTVRIIQITSSVHDKYLIYIINFIINCVIILGI